MKNSDSTNDDDIGDIRQKIIESWGRGKPPKKISDELGLPIALVYRILKDIQKQLIQRK